jgi:hypothetical protein
MLAGWLFADLLLVLFITAVASLPAPPSAHKTAEPKPHVTKHTPPPQPRVLERNPYTFYVNVSPADVSDSSTRNAAMTQLLGDLQRQLAAQGLQGQQAGFVLVFAYGPIGGIGQAISTADSVLDAVRVKMTAFSQVSGLGYWMGSGNFEFKIFFFA